MLHSDNPAADLGFSSIANLIHDFNEKYISPRELVIELSHRVENVDDETGGLNSVLALSQTALQSNVEFNPEQALSGIPIFIKDNIESIGLPATAGSLALVGRKVTVDAPLVKKLKQAGATIFGSTNLSEWANIRSAGSTSGWSAVGGLTGNPWSYKHSAGGSSSGSGASVAAGLVPVAIGTETDGSIVCPASLNGVVGIKPTVGKVSTQGIVPISFSQDAPGPIARNVSDATRVLGVLIGEQGLAESALADRPIRVGVVRQWVTSDDETNAIFENQVSALSRSGIQLVDLTVAELTDEAGDDEGTVLFHELVATMDKYLANRPGAGVKSLAEVVQFNLDNHESELHHFGQEFFELAINSGGLNEFYNSARIRNLTWAKEVLDPALADVDVLIGVPYGPAWLSTLGKGDDFQGTSWMTKPAAITGYPIASIPMGFVGNLPVGLGVIASANSELTLVQALTQFEKVLGLADLIPNFTK